MRAYGVILVLSIVFAEGFGRVATRSSTCPPGVRPVNCLVDPCRNNVCSTDTTLKCVSNYCGGCNALWFTPAGKEMECPSARQRRCPAGQREVQCFQDPCQGRTCPRDPTARCVSNYCGGCNFSWKKPNGKRAHC